MRRDGYLQETPAIPAPGPGRACRESDGDRDHCHQTLIEHAAGWLECPDPACGADRLAHAWVVSCGELAGGHGCLECEPAAADRAAREPDEDEGAAIAA